MPDRIIREGILTSDKVNKLSWFGEVFYRRLLNVVDDFGRYDARAEILRSTLFPLKTNQVSIPDIVKLLDECAKAGLVRYYEVGGKGYLEVNDFGQKGLKSKKQKYPPPEPEEKRREVEKEEKGKHARDYDLLYFEGIGYQWNLSEQLSNALNKFLVYRKKHPTHGPIVSGEQVEQILMEFASKKITDSEAAKMVDYTISRGAKNIIYETKKDFKTEASTGFYKSEAI